MTKPKKADKKRKKQEAKKKQPVVVLLGHVDHGKTTLIDFIRKTKITDKEPGKITQSIGAYEIEFQGQRISFIDTPGHEAFRKLRERGVVIADIALLVVAADEGPKQQTKEALQFIQKSKLPYIVVFTKIDLQKSDPDRAMNNLLKLGVQLEGFGGQVPHVDVSAKTGKGIDELLELIILLNELEGEEENISEGAAEAAVLTAYMDRRRGPIAALIVKKGIFKTGSGLYTTDSKVGKIKTMENFQGHTISEARPGQPFLVMGFDDLPLPGTSIYDQAVLEHSADAFKKEKFPMGLARKYDIEELVNKAKEKEKAVLKLFVKVREPGDGDAFVNVFNKKSFSFVTTRIVSIKEGDITTNDINEAIAIGAVLIGFRVGLAPEAKKMLRQTDLVIVRTFEVVYELEQMLKELAQAVLPKVREEIVSGKLRIKAVFRQEERDVVAGGMVEEGEVIDKAKFRLYSGEELKSEGVINGLEKNKKRAEKVQAGSLCGIKLKLAAKNVKIKPEDIIEVVTTKFESHEV